MRNLDTPRWFDFFGQRKRNYFLLALSIFIAYFNKFQNAFVLHDFDVIFNWELIKPLRNIPMVFTSTDYPLGFEGMYAPLKTFLYILFHNVFGTNPFGYHLLGIFGHIVTAIVVYQILFFLMKDDRLSFFGAALFALHPVQTAMVNPMNQVGDVWGYVCYFLAFLCYVRSYEPKNEGRRKSYMISIGAYAAGVFLAPNFIHLPVLFFIYDAMSDDIKVDSTSRKGIVMLKRLLPFVVVAGAYMVLKFGVTSFIFVHKAVFDNSYQTFLLKLLASGRYLLVLFMPQFLAYNPALSKDIYAFGVQDFSKMEFLFLSLWDIPILLILGCIGIMVYFLVQSYNKSRLVSFALSWLLFAPLPFIVLPTEYLYAESYLYGVLFGFCLMLAALIQMFFQHEGKSLLKKMGYLYIAGLLALMFLYAGRIMQRNKDWRNNISFYSAAIKDNPTYFRLRYELGVALLQYQQPQAAVEQFARTLALKPDFTVAYLDMAESFMMLNRDKQAIAVLEEAITVDREFADAHYNLAGLYAKWGMYKKAKAASVVAVTHYRRQEGETKAMFMKQRFERYAMSVLRKKVKEFGRMAEDRRQTGQKDAE